MNLQTAQLGNTNGISLGGYIPVAQKQPGLLDQALSSLASSVVGAVAQRGVEGLMTPDMGQQAVANDVQMAGMTRGPDGKLVDNATWLQRNFSPRDQKTYQHALGQQQENKYRGDVLAQSTASDAARLEEMRLGRIDTSTRATAAEVAQQKRFEAAREEALREYEANERYRKESLRLQSIPLERTDPTNPRNVEQQRLALEKELAQTELIKANTAATQATTNQVNSLADQLKNPAREAAIKQFIESKGMSKNPMAFSGLQVELPTGWDPKDPQVLEAAYARAMANAGAGMGTPGLTPEQLQAASDRPYFNKMGDIVTGLGQATAKAVDAPNYFLNRFVYSRPQIEAGRVAGSPVMFGLPQMSNSGTTTDAEAIARLQAALKAQNY